MYVKRRSVLGATVVAIALLVTGCTGAADNSDADDSSAGRSSDAFPVTVEHRFGETTITEKPQRILALTVDATDELLSLGIVPVATGSQEWSGGEDGFNDWTSDAIEELGAELPALLISNEHEPDYEEFLSYAPDLIFATSAVMEETTYERLSEIAPTVAYASEYSWQTQMLNTGAAVGELDKAEDVVAQTEAVFDGLRAEHPEFEGTTFVSSRALLEGFTDMIFYASDTPQPLFTSSLGLTSAPVSERGSATTNNSNSVSLEELDTVETDLWIGFLNSPGDGEITLQNPLIAAWKPFATGNYVMLSDRQLTQAVSLSTPLSIEWGAPRLADDIAEVIANAEG